MVEYHFFGQNRTDVVEPGGCLFDLSEAVGPGARRNKLKDWDEPGVSSTQYTIMCLAIPGAEPRVGPLITAVGTRETVNSGLLLYLQALR